MCKKTKRLAVVQQDACVACGTCADVCPRGAVTIWHGSHAVVDAALCVGCGKCARECPASVIQVEVGA